jgi:hypothetical protein
MKNDVMTSIVRSALVVLIAVVFFMAVYNRQNADENPCNNQCNGCPMMKKCEQIEHLKSNI